MAQTGTTARPKVALDQAHDERDPQGPECDEQHAAEVADPLLGIAILEHPGTEGEVHADGGPEDRPQGGEFPYRRLRQRIVHAEGSRETATDNATNQPGANEVSKSGEVGSLAAAEWAQEGNEGS